MRWAPFQALLCLAASSFGAGCVIVEAPRPVEIPRPAAPPREAAAPSWVPAYSAEQLELLTPSQHAIEAPATRVFPDLERFGYADDRRLASPLEAIKFTEMVAKRLRDSPRLYILSEAPPSAANPVVQYGPAPTGTDGFKVVRRIGSGTSIGELVAPPGAAEARGFAAMAEEVSAKGDTAGAIKVYRLAGLKLPGIPALDFGLGNALRRRPGHEADAEAEAAYRAALASDPTFAPAHLALAEIFELRHEGSAARHEVIEALSYDPSSLPARALAHRLGAASFVGDPGAARARPNPDDGGWIDRPAPRPRAKPQPIFLDVDRVGGIHVGTGPGDAATMYGGCRALLRHEPDLRARLLGEARGTPYHLGVAEEVICLEAGIGAYQAARGAHPETEIDPNLEELARVAHTDGLSGFAMFEILGRHRPERARAAPADVHRSVVSYIERHLFGQTDAPAGDFTAAR